MMAEASYEVTDRRPIAARKLAVMQRLADRMAAAGVSANAISVAGMVCGMLAGGCFACTAEVNPLSARVLWLAGAGLVQLRLLANLFDGMVAVASHTASRLGEIFNEAPDRISDWFTLLGLGWASGGSVWLGWCAAVLAILTAYVRMLGKAAGAGSDFCGPMAKQQRMALVTAVATFCAITPLAWQRWHPAEVGLAVIVAGCVVTVVRRVMRLAAKLRRGA